MTKAAISKSMRELPISDRIDLVDELLHSIAKDETDIPVPHWQKKLLDKRAEDYKRHPENAISGSQFRAKVKKAAARMRADARKKAA